MVSLISERQQLEGSIAMTPAHATVKGMYIDALLQELDRQRIVRPTTARFISFKDYPLRDFMRMLIDYSGLVVHDATPREALRQLGHSVFPTLAESTVGRIIFSIAGRNWIQALMLSPRAWEISLKPGSVQLCDVTETSARMALRDVWNFADTYQVGIIEGAMEVFRIEGTVRPQVLNRRCDVDLHLEW